MWGKGKFFCDDFFEWIQSLPEKPRLAVMEVAPTGFAEGGQWVMLTLLFWPIVHSPELLHIGGELRRKTQQLLILLT
jgi:hypothetical protein